MMEKADRGIGKALVTSRWILLIFISFILFLAPTGEMNNSEAASSEMVSQGSDQGGAVASRNYDSASMSPFEDEDGSTGRTLSQY